MQSYDRNKRTMKTLYQINNNSMDGEMFVDKYGNFVHYMYEYEGNYRKEYMGELISFFDGVIEELYVETPKNLIETMEQCDSDGEAYYEIIRPAILLALAKRKKGK